MVAILENLSVIQSVVFYGVIVIGGIILGNSLRRI